MQRIAPRPGLIGFFDILGYTNFLENNEPITAASVTIDILNKLEAKVPKVAVATLTGPGEKFKPDMKKIRWLVFSDTILMSFPWEKLKSDERRVEQWCSFLYCSMILSRVMFDFGLPLLGAITSGDYIVEGDCFAGRPIVEAYKLGHGLEIAGTVLSDVASRDLHALFRKTGLGLQHIGYDYLVPFKGGINKRCFILSPTPCSVPLIGDISQLIAETFWGHKKDVPPEVYPKLRNTELFFRYVKAVHGHAFADHAPEAKLKTAKRRTKRIGPTSPHD